MSGCWQDNSFCTDSHRFTTCRVECRVCQKHLREIGNFANCANKPLALFCACQAELLTLKLGSVVSGSKKKSEQ